MGSLVVRAAVASRDGQSIDRHFGRASRFSIYQWDGVAFQYECERRVPPLCGEDGHGEDLDGSTARFADCRFILAVTAGPPVVQAFARQGASLLEAEGPADTALEKLARSPLYRNVFQTRSSSHG